MFVAFCDIIFTHVHSVTPARHQLHPLRTFTVRHDNDASRRDGKKVMGIQSKPELSQKLIEMFNDTAFELLRDGFEIKQPMSLEDWTDIHAPDE